MLTRVINRTALFRRSRYSFAEDDDGEERVGAPKSMEDTATQLRRRFDGEIKIQDRFHTKTSALYDRYLQTRERPLLCHDGLHVAYEFVIERVPIFAGYQPEHFSIERNRYQYGKKTGHYVPIPKELRIDQAEQPFKDYDQNNEQNAISHQIALSQTQKINYRQNSRVWKWADPNVTDHHSIQAYGTHSVYLLVKENGKWIFPTKVLNQRDTHKSVFDSMSLHLFQSTPYPNVHFPSRKPMGVRHESREDLKNKVRVFTFMGTSAFGIPRFPTDRFEDFAWVPKPKLADYFDDQYHEDAAWAACHNFV